MICPTTNEIDDVCLRSLADYLLLSGFAMYIKLYSDEMCWWNVLMNCAMKCQPSNEHSDCHHYMLHIAMHSQIVIASSDHLTPELYCIYFGHEACWTSCMWMHNTIAKPGQLDNQSLSVKVLEYVPTNWKECLNKCLNTHQQKMALQTKWTWHPGCCSWPCNP